MTSIKYTVRRTGKREQGVTQSSKHGAIAEAIRLNRRYGLTFEVCEWRRGMYGWSCTVVHEAHDRSADPCPTDSKSQSRI
jgi:hypothetical protein